MFDYIYEWIQNIAFYLVLVTAVLHAVPNKDYKKYIRFFTGLVLILMILTPVLKIFGTEIRITDFIKEVEEYTEGESIQSLENAMAKEAQRFWNNEAEESSEGREMTENNSGIAGESSEGSERGADGIEVEEIQIDWQEGF